MRWYAWPDDGSQTIKHTQDIMKRPDITPGPWTFEPMKREQPAEFVVFHDSGSVCRLYEGTRTRQQPNAKAIAALPL